MRLQEKKWKMPERWGIPWKMPQGTKGDQNLQKPVWDWGKMAFKKGLNGESQQKLVPTACQEKEYVAEEYALWEYALEKYAVMKICSHKNMWP